MPSLNEPFNRWAPPPLSNCMCVLQSFIGGGVGVPGSAELRVHVFVQCAR